MLQNITSIFPINSLAAATAGRVKKELKWNVHIREFTVKGVSLSLVENENGAINWTPHVTEKPPTDAPKEPTVLVPLAEDISSFGTRLLAYIHQLQSILDRLEL